MFENLCFCFTTYVLLCLQQHKLNKRRSKHVQFLQSIYLSVHASTSITKISQTLREFFEDFDVFLNHNKEMYQCRVWSTSNVRRKLRYDLCVLNFLFVALDIITKNASEEGVTITWDDTSRASDIYQHLNLEFEDEETEEIIILSIAYLTVFNKAADGIEASIIEADDRLQKYVDLLMKPEHVEIIRAAFGEIQVTKTVAERVENGKADRAKVKFSTKYE